jgi:hypothetical protein
LISDEWYAGTGVNSWEIMQSRMLQCWRQLAAQLRHSSGFPNLVVVNYYEQGDTMAVVDWLNTQFGQVIHFSVVLNAREMQEWPSTHPARLLAPTQLGRHQLPQDSSTC